jgi:tetratricopeptide (TPR) repeat protein
MMTTFGSGLAVAALVSLVGASVSEAQDKPASPPTAAPRKKPATPPARKPAASPQFDALAREAAAAREANRLEDAIGLYQKAVKLQPSWIEGHWYLGTLNYELDRYAEARDAFRRVVTAQKENGAAHGMKGLCEFRLKNYETALSDLLRASDLGLGSNRELQSVVRYHTAIIMTRLEQYDFAMLQLEPIAQQGNESPTVIEALGLAALRIPMLPSELPPDRREMVLLAGRGAYYQFNRAPVPARKALQELVERYPDSPNTHYAFGSFLLQGESDLAIEEFKKELSLSPGHVSAMLQIAFEYIKRSDWESAKPWAMEAVKTAPKDFASRRALGQVLLELGDTPGAVEQLEIGVKLADDSPSLRFALARAYQKAGRTEDAERERAEFRRLERLIRSGRHGEQAIGGVQEPSKPQ